MSDDWITLIPENPNHIPDEASIHRARKRLAEITPAAHEITFKITEKTTFFDCGVNFSRVFCPACGAELPMHWWQDTMGVDYVDKGFKLNKYVVPCCGVQRNLHELKYDWEQGFGRFALESMNPVIDELDDKEKQELENILGTSLRVIYQHI